MELRRFLVLAAMVTCLGWSAAASAQPDEGAPAPAPDDTAGEETTPSEVDTDAEPAAEAPPEGDGSADAASGDAPSSATGSDAEAPPRRDAVGPSRDMGDPTQSGLLSDEQVIAEEELGAHTIRRRTDPYEDPNNTYYFLGAFYRHTFMPSNFLEKLPPYSVFVETGPDVSNPQVGLDLTVRRDGFDIVAQAYYARYSAYGPFLGPDDTDDEIEIIDSDLHAVMLAGNFMWEASLHDMFSIQFGIGVGIGGVFGKLRRTEAYPSNGTRGAGEANGFAPCIRPEAEGENGTPFGGDPNDTSDDLDDVRPLIEGQDRQEVANFYCGVPSEGTTDLDGESGEHYGVTARNWANGGSVPLLWLRVAPQISLRFKPIHQLMLRVDGGWDLLSGVYVGGAIATGF